MGARQRALCYTDQMYKTLLTVLLVLTWLTIPGHAQARDYDVEVIIFTTEDSMENPVGDDEEMWDFSPAHLSSSQKRMQNLSARSTEIRTRPILDRLESIRKDLVESGYKTLKTAKWTQPARVYNKAPLVSLGNLYTSMPHCYIRVYKTSLLFADVDCQITPRDIPELASFVDEIPDPDQTRLIVDKETSYPPNFFLSEKRRLKFKEVHYFDHPKVGVILGVWPA